MNINASVPSYTYPLATTRSSGVTETGQATSAATPSAQTESATTTAQQIPIEAYAIPQWQKGFYRNVSSEFVTGMPAGYVAAENAGFAAASQTELADYAALLHKHTSSVYEQYGLLDIAERYKALKANKALDQALHEQFNASVSADPEMMALMARLGVSLS